MTLIKYYWKSNRSKLHQLKENCKTFCGLEIINGIWLDDYFDSDWKSLDLCKKCHNNSLKASHYPTVKAHKG